MKKILKAPDPIDENIFAFTEKKAKRMRVRNVPGSLDEAVRKMEKSDFAKGVLGEHAFEKYLEAKKQDVEGYKLQVSDWELDRYLDIY